jgi:phosphatidylcholine synthase
MSKEKNIKIDEIFKHEKFLGTLVHLLTGLGIVAGFFALIAVMNNNQKDAFLWLGLAFLIDSVDGNLARKFNVKKNLPNIDGKMLDSIIDFFNYVIIPSIMIYWFRYVPDQFVLLIPAILIFISIFSYVNLNILTNDNYYNGFPAIWNVIVLYFYIFGTSQHFNLIFLIMLIVLKFSPLKCIHPLRVKKFKNLSILFAIFWFITSILLILIKDMNINSVYEVSLMFLWVVSNIYFISVSIFKTLRN